MALQAKLIVIMICFFIVTFACVIERFLQDMEIIDALQRGEWVNGIHPEVSRKLLAAEDACHRFNALLPSDIVERRSIIRSLLGSVGDNFTIHSPFRCDFGEYISIGRDFVSNYNLTILDEAPVAIGDRVFIGPNVSIYTIVHALDPVQRAAGVMRARPVTIGDDVWICGNVTILPGVTIGNGAVIGAGSTVTSDIPPMTLAIGSPCRPVRRITESDRIARIWQPE